MGPGSTTKGCELRGLGFQWRGAMLVLEIPWFYSQQPHGPPAAVRPRDASIEWDGRLGLASVVGAAFGIDSVI